MVVDNVMMEGEKVKLFGKFAVEHKSQPAMCEAKKIWWESMLNPEVLPASI